MIVKSFVVALVLSVGFISAVTGSSYSNVYVQRDFPTKEHYQYGTPYASIVNPRLSQVNAMPPVTGFISPCAPPCVLPGQAIAPAANVITYNAPSLPVVVAPNEDPAGYQYQYVVYDEHTGDHKAQREQSDGSVVRGEYSFLQPDGFIREVQYVADDVSGFNAVVRNFLPVTVEGKKKGETKGNKNSAIHCLEVKHESLKTGSEESSESQGSDGHGNSHNKESSKHSKHSENLSMESNVKGKHTMTKGSHDSAHDSQHHDEHHNKSDNESSESGSSEENHHSKSKHESEDVSHESQHTKSKKGSKTQSGEESFEESEGHSKGKHSVQSKKGSDSSEEESMEKSHKSKKGAKHSAVSSETSESSESEESGKQFHEHSKGQAKSKVRKGSGQRSEQGSSHESGHGSEHGSSHDSGHGSAHGSEHDAGHSSKHGSGNDSGHESEHGSSHDSEHTSHGSEHDSGHGSGHDSHGSDHDSGHSSGHDSHGSKHDSGHGSKRGSGHGSEETESHEVKEHQVLVPYNDIVRCVMQALKRSHGLPSGMSQEPSALSYLVLNKPC